MLGVCITMYELKRLTPFPYPFRYNRLEQIKKMRWEFGSVLPPEVKFNMCEQEVHIAGTCISSCLEKNMF